VVGEALKVELERGDRGGVLMAKHGSFGEMVRLHYDDTDED
jgi:hypothetical protein